MSDTSLVEEKRRLRAQVRARRRAVENAEALSRLILDRATTLPAYLQARTAMYYLDSGSEVKTRERLVAALGGRKTIVIPWCEADQLQLFALKAIDELAPGRYNILEPRRELRERPERRVAPESLDVVLAPGVAFDRQGRRLGQGRGYYDRLFPRLRPDATIIGLAFETQVLPEIPVEEHDVQMHFVVTERAIYPN